MLAALTFTEPDLVSLTTDVSDVSAWVSAWALGLTQGSTTGPFPASQHTIGDTTKLESWSANAPMTLMS